jgi:hypothetical protein
MTWEIFKEENDTQSITELWKTTIGKLAIGGCGVLAALLFICSIYTVFSGLLVLRDYTVQEAAFPPVETPTESLPAETLTEPLPTETPTEPLPTETATQPPAEKAPPTETPTSEAESVVTAGESNVNLRNGPSTDYEMAGTLSPGESLEIVGRNADSSWWQVSIPDGLAWVAARVVTVSNVDDSIPIAEAPPPPIQPTPTEPPPQPTAEPTQPESETVLACSGNVDGCSDAASHQSVQACSDYCASTGESYGDLAVNGGPTNPPAEKHPDLNLARRGYKSTNADKELVHYNGESDPKAPQLPGLFADNRTPTFSAVYQIYGWNWEYNRRGSLVTDPEVTMAGLAVTPGETIHVPDSGYTIGSGYEVLMLYASSDRITLKYTPDDDVIWGYTLHVENICVEPRLLDLYQSWNEVGRGHLPTLRSGQAFGCARGNEIRVVIRDRGDFMDPRSRKDWWQGR